MAEHSTKPEITLFESAEFGAVRGLLRDGEPWFVAGDIAKALGYSNPSRSVQEHCKYAELFRPTESVGLELNPCGELVIPESDVYALIFRSNLPKAEEFRRWVCEEVLPSIRKTGQYTLMPASFAEALRAYADEVEAHEATRNALAVEQDAHQHTREFLSLAEAQRDKAVREKAWIGTHREATAMGTASAATKRANNWKRSVGELANVAETQRETIHELQDTIGQGKTWRTVKGIEWLSEVFITSGKTQEERKLVKAMYQQAGKKLAALGISMGLPPKEIPDEEFGTVKKHHVKVIERFYNQLMANPCMMQKYRVSLA